MKEIFKTKDFRISKEAAGEFFSGFPAATLILESRLSRPFVHFITGRAIETIRNYFLHCFYKIARCFLIRLTPVIRHLKITGRVL